jgi:hypothetical protein
MTLKPDLAIKYYLNVYNEEDLQDELAVLFNILQYLLKVADIKNRSLDLENLKFTTNSLKYVFGEKVKNDDFKSNLIKKIKYLIQEKYLTVKKENFYITKNGISEFYIIND